MGTNSDHSDARVIVIDKDLEEMLISAVRYSLGRRTYIVGDTVRFMTALLPQLSDWCINVMCRDLADEFTLAARVTTYSPLGDPCDVAEWDKFKAALESEINRREKQSND